MLDFLKFDRLNHTRDSIIDSFAMKTFAFDLSVPFQRNPLSTRCSSYLSFVRFYHGINIAHYDDVCEHHRRNGGSPCLSESAFECVNLWLVVSVMFR